MSKKQLIEVFGGFSETTLVDMIMAKIRELFFAGDWGSANAIVDYILAEVDDVALKSRVAGFGVFAAVRAKDAGVAIARYQQLLEMPDCGGKAEVIIGSLAHLADILLPEQVELLSRFWLQTERPNKSLQEKYASLGQALWRSCQNNSMLRQEIMAALQQNLPVALFARICGNQGK